MLPPFNGTNKILCCKRDGEGRKLTANLENYTSIYITLNTREILIINLLESEMISSLPSPLYSYIYLDT